jgi:hypothetical protein
MEARKATSPGKAEATERQPIPILVPLTLPGSFDLTAIIAVASLALRGDQHTPLSEPKGQEDT